MHKHNRFASIIQAAHKRYNNSTKQFVCRDMNTQDSFNLAQKSEQLEETMEAAILLDEILKEGNIYEDSDFYELFLKVPFSPLVPNRFLMNLLFQQKIVSI